MIPAAVNRDLEPLYAAHVQEWTARFETALESAGFDSAIVLAGTEQLVFRDDQAYPFAAEPYFKAWVPMGRHPGSAIRFEPGRRPRLIYYQPTGFWHEPPQRPTGAWLEHFELCCVDDMTARNAALGPPTGRVAAIGPPDAGLGDTVVFNDVGLLAALDYTRARKTDYEIARIAEADAIAARGHLAACRAYAENASEFTIHQAYCEASRQRESELPYPSIVALNEHAAVLHYQNLTHDRGGTPSAFLIDAGADCCGYAADITRTYCRGSDSMRMLIDAVDEMQRALCSRAASGIDFVALNDMAHRLLGDVLRAAGLIRCTAEEAYERGITCTFLPHGLGHLLGLQVHDAGGRLAAPDGTERKPPAEHPMLRLTRTLEPGFVVTIEPGLYFIPSLLEALRTSEQSGAVSWPDVDALARFGGIRIEDDVLVTETGPRNLSRSALEHAAD